MAGRRARRPASTGSLGSEARVSLIALRNRGPQKKVLLRRLKFALPGWTEAESRRGAWARESAQRAAQARAFSGEGHSEEWGFFFSGSSH